MACDDRTLRKGSRRLPALEVGPSSSQIVGLVAVVHQSDVAQGGSQAAMPGGGRRRCGRWRRGGRVLGQQERPCQHDGDGTGWSSHHDTQHTDDEHQSSVLEDLVTTPQALHCVQCHGC